MFNYNPSVQETGSSDRPSGYDDYRDVGQFANHIEPTRGNRRQRNHVIGLPFNDHSNSRNSLLRPVQHTDQQATQRTAENLCK